MKNKDKQNKLQAKALEYSSKELLALSRKETPDRYARRLELGPTKVIDARLDYKTGNAIIELITHDHEQTLQIEDFIDLVAAEILSKYKNGVKRTDLMRIVKVAVRLLLEEGDVLVDCDCEDYKYRFNWLAKQYGFALIDRVVGFNYKPDISNPRQIGGICKHITKVLARSSQWADQASRKLINEILQYETFLDLVIEDVADPEDEVVFDDEFDKLADDAAATDDLILEEIDEDDIEDTEEVPE